MSSNVGDPRVYEAGDQRTTKNSELQDKNRYHEGNVNAHLPNDSKDQRSIANRLAEREQHESSKTENGRQRDPTQPAIQHGNEPSRGAIIDKELQEEDEAAARKKGQNLPGKKM
ncbi:hypothetical protein VTK73DRAFT_2721 [Phialemonium thermophilum]|uniref:Uncharacterized protein n=1 Tax=Phialemonium thermophilum TaxID=223376 RepID=A0ABR3X2Z3_9PEZI